MEEELPGGAVEIPFAGLVEGFEHVLHDVAGAVLREVVGESLARLVGKGDEVLLWIDRENSLRCQSSFLVVCAKHLENSMIRKKSTNRNIWSIDRPEHRPLFLTLKSSIKKKKQISIILDILLKEKAIVSW